MALVRSATNRGSSDSASSRFVAVTFHHSSCPPARQVDGTRPCLRGLSKPCQAANAAAYSCGRFWIAVLSVRAIVVLNAVAATLAHPDPAAVVAGNDVDPVTTAVVSSFGSWSDRPFAAVVLTAFISCGIAAQALTARTIYSVARDDALPASRFLRSVNARGVPVGGTIVTVVVGCLGLLLGLKSATVGTLIAFGTAAIYVSFLMTAVAALIARSRGSWRPLVTRRAALLVNIMAVGWLAFETINIAWPRASIAPPGAPFYRVWAAPLSLAFIALLGAGYLAAVRPRGS
jgi:amino acid transporter